MVRRAREALFALSGFEMRQRQASTRMIEKAGYTPCGPSYAE